MKLKEVEVILSNIEFEDYTFCAHQRGDIIYLQAGYYEDDIITGRREHQKTRKWLLSEHMVKSEVVQTAFKCVMTSMEHRVREHFLYRQERIFGPHFDVDALYDIAKARRLDYRGKS